MTKRRVVITGVGMVSACGMGAEPLWQQALEGRSAIRELSSFASGGSPIRVGGEVPDFKPEEFVTQRKSLKVMSRDIQLAVAASSLALRDSAVSVKEIDVTRAGVVLGSGLINNDLQELGLGIKQSLDPEGRFDLKRFGREGMRSLYPLWLLKYLPNMPACHISILHGLKGPNNTLLTSGTGGIQAVGEACRVIEREDADLMLAGAADSKINPLGLSRFHLLGWLSQQNHVPAEVYRPFDRRRDGMVVGEGGGIFLLEEREHALKRGARIYGEIIGYSASVEKTGGVLQKLGGRLPFFRAMEEAGRGGAEIDFLHADGSGIPQEDIQEAKTVSALFSGRTSRMPVTASKSVTGHLIDAAGMPELALALRALKEGVLPPIANLEEPDPECDLNFVMGEPQRVAARTFLLHARGFGGQNAALVVAREKNQT